MDIVSNFNIIDYFITLFFLFCTVRQIITLLSMKRSRDFIASRIELEKENLQGEDFHCRFEIIIPILSEQKILRETFKYFAFFKEYESVDVIFITTERENLEKNCSPPQSSIDILNELFEESSIKHVHFPYDNGLKGDQINYFIDKDANLYSSENTKKGIKETSFVLIYDADSRPDLKSIYALKESFGRFPNFNIFQQPSWFRSHLRKENNNFHFKNLFLTTSALRANRFVLAYELPRLIGRLKYSFGDRDFLSIISKFMYSHVTGHGLCIRKSFLYKYPFPQNTLIEDMHYGFMLNCMREVVIPINILDKATVPPTFIETFKQSIRWFLGPSRCFKYIITMKQYYSFYAWIITLSAMYISIEWILCAIVPLLSFFFLIGGLLITQIAIFVFIFVYFLTFIYAIIICRENGEKISFWTLLLCPIIVFIFGLAGLFGLFQLFTNEKKHNGFKTKRG